MRSEIKIFYESGYLKNRVIDEDKILPFSEFKLFRDMDGELTINPDFGDFMVELAEKILDEPIPVLPLSLYREKKAKGIRSNFERVHHRRRKMLFDLAFAEAYENKGRFVEKMADVAWAIMDETSWVIPAHTYHSPTASGTDVPETYREDIIPALELYSANCSATLALVKYLHKDKLDAISPIICKKIDHLVYLRAIRPYITCSFRWMGFEGNNINNWSTNITSSILFATAVTVTDTAIRKRVVERAMNILDNFTSSYPEDGFCDEGPGYWGGAAGNYFDCLELIEDITGGKIDVYSHPLIKKMGEYIVKFNIDKNYYLCFADARPRVEHDGKVIIRYGKKCGSKSLERFGYMIARDNPVDRYYFFGVAFRTLKNSYIPEIKEAETTKAERTVWYDSGKVAIFRESSDTSRGMYLATKGGTNGELHNHNDVGCLVVYYDGKPVIVDPSHGSYDYGDFRYQKWYYNSSYHSIPIVDGIEQRAGLDFASSDEVYDGVNMSVSMELRGAFPSDAGIETMRRTCQLDGGVVTVRDEVKTGRDADVAFHYVTVDEPKPIGDGKLLLAEDRTFVYDTKYELTIEKIVNTNLPYEDLDFGMWDRECLYRITLRAHGSSFVNEIKIY